MVAKIRHLDRMVDGLRYEQLLPSLSERARPDRHQVQPRRIRLVHQLRMSEPKRAARRSALRAHPKLTVAGKSLFLIGDGRMRTVHTYNGHGSESRVEEEREQAETLRLGACQILCDNHSEPRLAAHWINGADTTY